MGALVWISGSEAETLALGRELARALRPPVWVGLSGPLGAGKTRFAQGLAQGLGYTGRVRSPTFVLENRYRGRIPILHQDLYRLDTVGEEMRAAWEENEDAVVIVEWAERSGEEPERAVRVRIDPFGPEERRLTIDWTEGAVEEAALPRPDRPPALGDGSGGGA